jgi:hypothetical protein
MAYNASTYADVKKYFAQGQGLSGIRRMPTANMITAKQKLLRLNKRM